MNKEQIKPGSTNKEIREKYGVGKTTASRAKKQGWIDLSKVHKRSTPETITRQARIKQVLSSDWLVLTRMGRGPTYSNVLRGTKIIDRQLFLDITRDLLGLRELCKDALNTEEEKLYRIIVKHELIKTSKFFGHNIWRRGFPLESEMEEFKGKLYKILADTAIN